MVLVLWVEIRASCLLGKYPPTELQPQPISFITLVRFFFNSNRTLPLSLWIFSCPPSYLTLALWRLTIFFKGGKPSHTESPQRAQRVETTSPSVHMFLGLAPVIKCNYGAFLPIARQVWGGPSDIPVHSRGPWVIAVLVMMASLRRSLLLGFWFL